MPRKYFGNNPTSTIIPLAEGEEDTISTSTDIKNVGFVVGVRLFDVKAKAGAVNLIPQPNELPIPCV
jgi:hypothetical protein